MTSSDLRNDLAVQAAKQLDAKIEEATRLAFDQGKDFIRSQHITHDRPSLMEPRPLEDRFIHTISYQARPIDPAEPTPAGFIRYRRPKGWRTGQTLR